MGRSGRLLAAEHYGVRADVTVLCKALGGGLPIGAVLMTDEVAAALAPGHARLHLRRQPGRDRGRRLRCSTRVTRRASSARVRRPRATLDAGLESARRRGTRRSRARAAWACCARSRSRAEAPFGPPELVRGGARARAAAGARRRARGAAAAAAQRDGRARSHEALALLDRALTKLESTTPERTREERETQNPESRARLLGRARHQHHRAVAEGELRLRGGVLLLERRAGRTSWTAWRRKARAIGAAEVVVEDLREPFLRDFVFPALRAGAVYEGAICSAPRSPAR